MTETDLSAWLLTMEAAMRIGCSTRTVERLKQDGKLEARLRPQRGSPDVVVFSPESVAEEARRRHPAPAAFVVGAGQGVGNGNGHRRALQKVSEAEQGVSAEDLIRQFFVLAVQALKSPPSPTTVPSVSVMAVSPEERAAQYLTLPEAVVIKRLTRTYLQRQCESGVLKGKAVKDGRRWKIKRTDLEQL